MKRKQLTPATRRLIYEKFNGHCAYCGREIAYKDMQVDHIKPLGAYSEANRGTDTIDNMYPACRLCNHYKRSSTVEAFRDMIHNIPFKLGRDSYIYKVGCAYGFFDTGPRPVEFYFERCGKPDKEA